MATDSPPACLVERLHNALDRLEIALEATRVRLAQADEAAAVLAAMQTDRASLAAELDAARAQAARKSARATAAEGRVAARARAADLAAKAALDTGGPGDAIQDAAGTA